MGQIKKENNQFLISTKDLTDLLEISDRTLTNWKRKGLRQHSYGWWDLKVVLKWRGLMYNYDSEVSPTLHDLKGGSS